MTPPLLTLLDELAALEKRATPGEWRVIPDPGENCEECAAWTAQKHMIAKGNVGVALILVDEREDANAAYIAALRNAHARLDAEVRRLVEALEKIEECAKRKGHHDTCSYALAGAEYACDCGAYLAYDALRAGRGAK